MTIFVSLAAYCEPHLEFTLDSLFSTSTLAEQIYVGLVDQSFDDNLSWLRHKPYAAQVRYLHVHPMQSQGACWARAIAQTFYRGETYLFQTDSHMLFDEDWDQRLILQFQRLAQQVSRPILSTYPPGFQFRDDGSTEKLHDPSPVLMALVPIDDPGYALQLDKVTLRFQVEYAQPQGTEQFIEGFHLAAGFLFTWGCFVDEVPYDPRLFFHGEEQNLMLRAFTRGWDVFHPTMANVPVFHLYKQANADFADSRWTPSMQEQRLAQVHAWTAASDQRLATLVSRTDGNGAYSLGSHRSLSDFANLSGIDYRARVLSFARNPALRRY